METPYKLSPVMLKLPAHPQMMLIVRLTTAGVLARSGLGVDQVEDLKMASEEACNCLIRVSHCSTLTLSFKIADGAFLLHAETGGCDCCQESSLTSEEIEVIRCVLDSLTDKAELVFQGGGLRAIDMRKNLR